MEVEPTLAGVFFGYYLTTTYLDTPTSSPNLFSKMLGLMAKLWNIYNDLKLALSWSPSWIRKPPGFQFDKVEHDEGSHQRRYSQWPVATVMTHWLELWKSQKCVKLFCYFLKIYIWNVLVLNWWWYIYLSIFLALPNQNRDILKLKVEGWRVNVMLYFKKYFHNFFHPKITLSSCFALDFPNISGDAGYYSISPYCVAPLYDLLWCPNIVWVSQLIMMIQSNRAQPVLTAPSGLLGALGVGCSQ